MKNTKQLIERLEKITGKKVILKEGSEQRWKMTVNGEDHTTDLSYEEAEGMQKEYQNDFPDEDYQIDIDFGAPKQRDTVRTVPRGAVDGWEDIYSRD